MSHILSIDQGTTSTRAILFNRNGEAAAKSQMNHRQIFPNPGWVSHDAEEIFRNVVETGRKAMEQARVSPGDITAVGITNQRETVVLWDKHTGRPVSGAVVWQCRRTADICARMEADGVKNTVREKTGLLIDPYFSATKIKWTLDNIPEARALMEKGRLLAGTIDTYLIWKLTGGKTHVTDFTNASRTMLFNIKELKWDDDLLKYFNIPREILPDIVPNAGPIAVIDASVWGAEIPVTGAAGDQHAALFGQNCVQPGDVKNTYGTGCFLLKNIGTEMPALQTENRLLTTLAWHIGGKPCYALEGSVFNAGSAIEWLINTAGLASSVEEINALCESAPDTNGAYFVPAFTGLGAPFWDMYARGTLCGLSLSTGRAHIARAVMESVAYQSRDVIAHMADISGLEMPALKADGGICKSDFTMRFQADLLQVPVERPRITETTAQGVFFMAGIGAGLFNMEEIKNLRAVERVFTPSAPKADMDEKYCLWLKAVEKSRGWVNAAAPQPL